MEFLRDIIGRRITEPEALRDLCAPVSVAVFRYENLSLNGLGTNLKQSECIACADCGDAPGLGPHDNSGTTFKDRLPDIVWKYVPIHEIGHYYGLCHVPSGLERIMFSGVSSGAFSWWTIPDYLYLRGEPTFILDEAKQVWDYIVEHVPAECLMRRPR